MADTTLSNNIVPGRVKGEWSPNTLYLVGDLICYWFDVTENPAASKYLWFVAKQTHTSSPITKPILDNAFTAGEHDYWEPSHWINVSESFTEPEKDPNLLINDTIEDYRQKFINNTYVSPEYRFQRVHSINPEMLDAYVMGKGVPSWYYYDLLGSFSARSNIRYPLELLTTIRGTLLGLKAWLNFINFNALIARIAPEEYYTAEGDTIDGEYREIPFGDYHLPRYEGSIEETEGWFKGIQETVKQFYERDNSPKALRLSNEHETLNATLPNAHAWSSEIDYKIGDYVYVNRYTIAGYYSTDRPRDESEVEFTYQGCDLFRAVRKVRFEEADKNNLSNVVIWNSDNSHAEGAVVLYENKCYRAKEEIPPGMTPAMGDESPWEHLSAWEWVSGYHIKKFEDEWDASCSPDNSFYRLEITQIADSNQEKASGKIVVTGEKWQSTLMLLLRQMIAFMLPAWIRVENGMILMDKRRVEVLRTSHAITEKMSDASGPEPYTLTIYPYVGFDSMDANYVEGMELNHTEAWKTEVLNEEYSSSDNPCPVYEATDVWQNIPDKGIKGFLSWERVRKLDAILLDPDNHAEKGGVARRAYMWKEDYLRVGDRALTKVRLLHGHKIRLKPYKIYDKKGSMPVWKDLNSYNYGETVTIDPLAYAYYRLNIRTAGGDRKPGSDNAWQPLDNTRNGQSWAEARMAPEWDSDTQYSRNDIVKFAISKEKTQIICKSLSDNNMASEKETVPVTYLQASLNAWKPLEFKEFTIPEYSAFNTYSADEIVYVQAEAMVTYYISLIDKNNNSITDAESWQRYAGDQAFPVRVEQWDRQIKYTAGSIVKSYVANYYRLVSGTGKGHPLVSVEWEKVPVIDVVNNNLRNKEYAAVQHDVWDADYLARIPSYTYYESLIGDNVGNPPLPWKRACYDEQRGYGEGLTAFWRWQLLNHYHNVPRFSNFYSQVIHGYLTYFQFCHRGNYPSNLRAYTHREVRDKLMEVSAYVRI